MKWIIISGTIAVIAAYIENYMLTALFVAILLFAVIPRDSKRKGSWEMEAMGG